MASGTLYRGLYGGTFERRAANTVGVYFQPIIWNASSSLGRQVYTQGDAIHVGTVGTYNSSSRVWTFQDYTPTRIQLNELALVRDFVNSQQQMPFTLDGVRMQWNEHNFATILLDPFRITMPVLDASVVTFGQLITGFDVDASGDAPVVSAIYKSDQVFTVSNVSIGTGTINGVQLDASVTADYSLTNIFANAYTYNPAGGVTAGSVQVVQYISGTIRMG